MPRLFPRPRQGHTHVPASATSMSATRICISPCHGRAHVPGRDKMQKVPDRDNMRNSPMQMYRFCKYAPNLFAEIRKNICGKTCAYFGKNAYVFAEIRLRFCGNKFESRQNALKCAALCIAWRAVSGIIHTQILISSNLTWIAPSNALGC